MKKISLALFVVASVGELVAIMLGNDLLHQTCKPLIMLSLCGHYWFVSEGNHSRTFVVAMIASWIGDVLLMVAEKDEAYFLFGLAAFLVTHVMLIITFHQFRDNNAGNPLRGVQSIRMAFPVVLAGTGLIILLYPSLGALKFPVVVYVLILMCMVLAALYRYGRTDFKSMITAFAGALLFMMSDSILAINKFLMPLDHAGFWIMLTYCAGQFLIVRGVILHPYKIINR
ncbi:lysoplasmalogenase [Pseudochryseolinea flava]|uniref:Lysoplasmalogenase n=1 Tax=Pseudochryseolinea flava TaxID=2059302 RepID=A0A364XXE2_9BACT|nr:lysoplasmalogenase [Pseudochryseolinea flava]RAV99066.1 hypothetical protein DQQ10_20950 [Pseudochryseolinea flava]